MKTVLDYLDTVSGVFLSPSKAFEHISNRKPVALALATAVCVAVVSGLVLVPNPPELAEVMFDRQKGTLSLWATLPVWIGVFLAVLCLQAAFIHLTALVVRSKGSGIGMLCGLCFAYLPGLLAAPLAMLRALFSSNGASAFYQTAFALLCLWVFFLGIAAIRGNYGITTFRAAALGLLAFVALVALPVVVAVLVMTRAMS